MAERGYAGTPVSVICKAAGVPPTSLYWHFNSKEGLLASVMERGAQRWFAELSDWDELEGSALERVTTIVSQGAVAVGSHPDFLRLFYTLAIEAKGDDAASAIVARVRRQAFEHFRRPIEKVLAEQFDAEVSARAADELARFAVAVSDGCFFATELEPADADVPLMFNSLAVAITALAPQAISRAQKTSERKKTHR